MSPIFVLLAVAGVAFILGRRMLGELVEIKGLLVLPVVLTAVGASQLGGLGGSAVALVILGCAISVGFGVLRGRTVHLGERDGHLWMRYTPASVGLWVANIAAKGALIPVEHVVTGGSAASHRLMLSLGVGILAETAVVLLRAMRSDSVVVWQKGEEGGPHSTSPAFEHARSYARGERVSSGRGW